jgi:hypothetical protein
MKTKGQGSPSTTTKAGVCVPRLTCPGEALPEITLLSHIRKVGQRAAIFLFDYQTSGTTGPKGPNLGPKPSKAHTPAVYADYYGPQDTGFAAVSCACFSVYASLLAESCKNASWVRNCWFAVGLYVNIK